MSTEKNTIKNFKIAEKFVKYAKELVDGIILSGSNAWGANYAVNKNSDIDLFFVVERIDCIGQIIDKYILNGFLDSNQKKRFEIFEKYWKNKKADTFSLKSLYRNTWVSIDFFPVGIVKNIVEFKPLEIVKIKDNNKEIDLRIINEFRSNSPKKEGYSLDALTEKKKIIYIPKFFEVKNREFIAGYIAKTLVDGMKKKGNKMDYYLGVMSFFLAVKPVILYDKNGKLNKFVKKIQLNIVKNLKGQAPVYITRQERMSNEILNNVRESFVKEKVF